MWRKEGWDNPYPYGRLSNPGLAYEKGADAMLESILKYMEEKYLFSMAHGKAIYSMGIKDYQALQSKEEPIYTPADYVDVHNR